MQFQSIDSHLPATDFTLQDVYKRLLETLCVRYSGIYTINYRIENSNALCPIMMTLRLVGDKSDQGSRSLVLGGEQESKEACKPQFSLRVGNLVRHNTVLGIGALFATSTGVLKQIGLESPFDHVVGDDDEEQRNWLGGPSREKRAQDVKGRLQSLLLRAPRPFVAAKYLNSFMATDNTIGHWLRDNFAETGTGLRVRLHCFETPLTPGGGVALNEGDVSACLTLEAEPGVEGSAAFAECIAAVCLLLDAIKCEMAPTVGASIRPHTLKPNQHQLSYLDGGFKSLPDSWTFGTGIREACKLVACQGRRLGLVDLGCGSAAPIVPIIADGTLYYYIGVDIDSEALSHARLNLEAIDGERYRIDQLDIVHRDAVGRIGRHMTHFPEDTVWILGANLPYLPTPNAGVLDLATDGGRRGLDLTPGVPITVARDLGIELVVLNVSSLCDLDGFLAAIETTPFRARRFVGTVASLEAYALKIMEYVREQKIGRPYGSHEAQIISALVLEQARGISVRKAMAYLERVLAGPLIWPEYTVALGKASGDICVCALALSVDSRSLLLHVQETDSYGWREAKYDREF